MNVELRRATQEDKKFIGRVCRETIPLYDDFLPGFFESQGTYLQKKLPQGYDFFIVEESKDPVGFICSKELREDVIYIAMLYFLPQYYRQGIGSKTMEIMEEKFKVKGYKYISLLAHKKAVWANNFYIKNGFKAMASNKQEVQKIMDGLLEQVYFNSTIVMIKELE